MAVQEVFKLCRIFQQKTYVNCWICKDDRYHDDPDKLASNPNTNLKHNALIALPKVDTFMHAQS